jgi:lipoate-protein ligase B
MDYHEVHAMQLRCVENQLSGADEDEYVFVTEHPSVFTVGKSGTLSSLLKSREEIEACGIDIIACERGGNITYHGPGQLVVYPVVNLRRRNLSVAAFIEMLEEIMVQTAAGFGVSAVRDPRNRGVWVGDNKLGSVGIRVRHGISFHGLALNVNLAVEPFSWIRPCGLTGVGVTSLAMENGGAVSMEAAKKIMLYHLKTIFGIVTEGWQ